MFSGTDGEEGNMDSVLLECDKCHGEGIQEETSCVLSGSVFKLCHQGTLLEKCDL